MVNDSKQYKSFGFYTINTKHYSVFHEKYADSNVVLATKNVLYYFFNPIKEQKLDAVPKSAAFVYIDTNYQVNICLGLIDGTTDGLTFLVFNDRLELLSSNWFWLNHIAMKKTWKKLEEKMETEQAIPIPQKFPSLYTKLHLDTLKKIRQDLEIVALYSKLPKIEGSVALAFWEWCCE